MYNIICKPMIKPRTTIKVERRQVPKCTCKLLVGCSHKCLFQDYQIMCNKQQTFNATCWSTLLEIKIDAKKMKVALNTCTQAKFKLQNKGKWNTRMW
jgi:hypothetical protein